MTQPTEVAFPEVQAVVDALRIEVWIRFMKRGQKAALLEWRDRRKAPGLAARFEIENAIFYDATPRRRWQKRRGIKVQRPFYHSGGFRDQVLKRKPSSPRRSDNKVASRLKLGGGVMNLLGSIRGSRVSISMQTVTVGVRAHTVSAYTRSRAGKNHTVSGHRRQAHIGQRSLAVRIEEFADETYQEEFANLAKDMPFFRKRVPELFMEIVRNAAFKKDGQRKAAFESPVLAHLDQRN